ncbi:tail protein [Vibrio phage D491]
MTVRVAGFLKTPLNTPAANIPIKIITTIGAGDTLSSSEVFYTTDANGAYGFDLVYATHEIYAMFDDAFELIGTSVANESVPTPTTINDLLHFSTPIQPEIVDKIYDDVYGCIDDLENDINTCMTCMSDQVVQGDVGVCQAMTVYTNDCLQACSAELTTAIQAGDAQTLSQAQAYTDATGTEIACCTEALSTELSEICTTMTSLTTANCEAIATVCTEIEAGDARTIQESKAYTDTCTGNVEANIINFVEACDASVYECLFAINCCVQIIDATSSKTWHQPDAPTGANQGDIWYDTDDGNKPYYLNTDGQWESVQDVSISVAQADANAAQAAAHAACVCACAYADGIVTAEEERAIADAQCKADEAESAACAHANAQSNLAAVCACAYADGIVTEEEARAIADAQAKADAAEANAIAVSDSLGSAAAAEQAACNYADANFVDSVTYGTDIAAIQAQLDKSITSWFGNDTPTANNYPASDWTTTTEKDVHLGDLYYDNDDGLSYRWSFDGGVYLWVQVIDSGITAALEAASKAQDTADQKRRVFFGTPVPPYDRGDLWDTGEGLRRADVASVTTFSEIHWLWATDANGAADNAELAACNYATAQVNLEQVRADAYADGVANAAEQAGICAAEACACAAEMNAKLYSDGCLTAAEVEIQAAYTAYADAAEAAAIVTANAYADGAADEAELAAIAAANACTNAAEVRANAYADGIVTSAEQNAIDTSQAYADAQDELYKVTLEAYADGAANQAEQAAIAAAEADVLAAEVRMCAYADGIVTESEQATIDAANCYADAQDALAKTTSEAYADGVATQAELDAIAAAEQNVAEAEARLQQEMDEKDTCCNAKIVACTNGLTGSIELLESDICDITQDVELQQSGYSIVTSAGDAQASIALLATSYSNSDVQCSEILMQADKIAMHNGDPTNNSYPFYVENNCVYMANAYIKDIRGEQISSDTTIIAGGDQTGKYTVTVKKGYGYGFQSTLNNITPTEFKVRGLDVQLFSYSEPDNRTFLWFEGNATPSDISPLSMKVDGINYTLTWNSGYKAFETEVGVKAFTPDELDTDIVVIDNASSGYTGGPNVAGMNGNDSGSMTSNRYKDIRFWAGSEYPRSTTGALYAPFAVDKHGKLTAMNADIWGNINAYSLTFIDDANIPPEIANSLVFYSPNIVADNGEKIVEESTYGGTGYGWTTLPDNMLPSAYAKPTSSTTYDFRDCHVETRFFSGGDPYIFVNSASENDTPRFYLSNVYNNYNVNVDPRSSITVKFKAKFSKFGNTVIPKPTVGMIFLYDDVAVSDPATWKGITHDWTSGLEWDTYYNFEYTLDLNREAQSTNPTTPGTLRLHIAPHTQAIIYDVEILQRVYKPYVSTYNFYEEKLSGVNAGDKLSIGVDYIGSQADLIWGLRSKNSDGSTKWEKKATVSGINSSIWATAIQENLTVDSIVDGGEGGLYLFFDKNSAPSNWGSSLHSWINIRNLQAVIGEDYIPHALPVNDPGKYPDQQSGSSPQISGGGWTNPDSESGWGVMGSGDAYFNSVTVKNGTISSGTIIGADIYAGNTYHQVDYNTDNQSDTVYYKKYPDLVPLYANASFSGRDYGSINAVGVQGAITDVYVKAWDVVSCLETRGEVNTRRFRWGKVRAGALTLSVQIPGQYVDYFGIDVFIVDDNGWQRGVPDYPLPWAGRYVTGTMELGPMSFDYVINNTGSTYTLTLTNKECRQFGDLREDLYNGRYYVKVRAGIDGGRSVPVTYDLKYTVDNDTFPG